MAPTVITLSSVAADALALPDADALPEVELLEQPAKANADKARVAASTPVKIFFLNFMVHSFHVPQLRLLFCCFRSLFKSSGTCLFDAA